MFSRVLIVAVVAVFSSAGQDDISIVTGDFTYQDAVTQSRLVIIKSLIE